MIHISKILEERAKEYERRSGMPFTKLNATTYGFKGHKHSDETKRLISANRKGKGLGERPDWVKEKIRAAHLKKLEE